MTGSERNFRSHYYEKVGFRGVEEKKSLDLLLSERPVELGRVANFSLRFPLPAVQRVSVWKLVLGVLPTYTSVTEHVWQTRVSHYYEVERALLLTGHLQPNSPPCLSATLCWLLETRRLRSEAWPRQLSESRVANFRALAAALSHLVETKEEVFWLAKGFHSLLSPFSSCSRAGDCAPLTECLLKLIREDSVLVDHLRSLGLSSCPSYHLLLGGGLSKLLSPCLLPRLWDRLVGGSVKVLVYVLGAALTKMRQEVLSCDSAPGLVSLLEGIQEDSDRQEAILNKGLDLWEADGCPLLPCISHNNSHPQEAAENRSNKLESRLSLEINLH